MRPEERDPAYLWDMREFARDARSMADGLSRRAEREPDGPARARESDRADRRKRFARIFVVPGGTSEIPWAGIIGMRHRLVHDYRRIDSERIWDVIHQDIPPLLTALDALVPPPPREPE